MSVITSLCFSVIILIIGYFAHKTDDSIQIIYWLAGWTAYQVPRHYFIARRKYRQALTLDLSIIICSIASLHFGNKENISHLLAISMLLCGLATFILLQINSSARQPKISYELKGLEFGLTNFLSGGISLSLIPLATYFEGEAFSGVISIFISIVAVALLIPRAISLNQMPTISKNLDNTKNLFPAIAEMKQKIFASNIFSTLASLIVSGFLAWNVPQDINRLSILFVTLAITLQNYTNTQLLTSATILMAKENSKIMLLASFFVFIAFSLAATALYTTELENKFSILCGLLTLLLFTRTFVTNRIADAEIKKPNLKAGL
ncbi:hypothetical protein D3C75_599280 [compost metagenome]